MPISTLKARYLDDRKLAQLAWFEFARAMQTRRVVAFVGSMATEALGYPSWADLVARYFAMARDLIDELTARATDDGELVRDRDWARSKIDEFEQNRSNLTDTVAMSLVGEVLEHERVRRWRPRAIANPDPQGTQSWPLDAGQEHLERLSAGFAEEYRQPKGGLSGLPPGKVVGEAAIAARKQQLQAMDVPNLLFDTMDIRRFATTNYDFEIERKTMLRDQEKWDENGDRLASPFAELRALRDIPAHARAAEVFDWDLGSGRIRRVLTHGKAAESDLLNRERIDRLIEFAIGTDDVDSHVMHLHGRACDWSSMIVTQRDYDRLYRSNDLNRLPFEFARRLMMGGNPMLFVGLGMKEADVNRELQEFISNNRYHRTAPAFLLWSAIPGALSQEEISSIRLDYLHRLGVLTIFDTDFSLTDRQRELQQEALSAQALVKAALADEALAKAVADAAGPAAGKVEVTRKRDALLGRGEQLEALALSVRAVAERLETHPTRDNHIAQVWRNAGKLLDRRDSPEHATLQILWRRSPQPIGRTPPAVQAGPAQEEAWCQPSAKLLSAVKAHAFLCILGSSGCGKGHASLALAKVLSTQGPCLLINGGFSFDTDSMLSGIAEFLSRFLAIKKLPGTSRSAYFAALVGAGNVALDAAVAGNGSPGQLYIVLNGTERFFSITGRPLSAELDQLMHMDIGNVRWIIFGTERVRHHAEIALRAEIERFEYFYPASAGRQAARDIPFLYMQEIVDRVRAAAPVAQDATRLSFGDWRVVETEVARFRALSAGKISGDSQHLREAFFTWALDGHVLAVLLRPDDQPGASRATVTLAQMILRLLCFFGLPVERAVLHSVPAIREAARQAGLDIDAVLDKLVGRGMVLRLAGYAGYGSDDPDDNHRYALHRALLTDLRSRFAIPLSEAKLSTSFNMSLYVAQPVDGYIPEPAMHDELGGLMDSLMGYYRDVGSETDAADALAKVAADHRLDIGQFQGWLTTAAGQAQSSEHPDHLDKPIAQMRIHQLCRYANVQRLRATLAVARGFYSTTGILTLDNGDRLVREDRDGILLEHAERLDRLVDMYAKMALARRSLAGAFALAGLGATFKRIYGEGEAFYAEELVWLHNERGVVRLAMGDLYEAKASLELAMAVNRQHVEFSERDHNWRRIRLNQLSVEVEMGAIGLARRMAEEVVVVSREEKPLLTGERHRAMSPEQVFLREDRLAIAIAVGHLGWCSHLQGDDAKANAWYETAIASLSELEEVRAQAFFRRLQVDVDQSRDNPGNNREAMEKALDLVEATRQMDLVHRFQVTLAYAYFHSKDDTLRQKSHRMLEEALQYGLLADVHRVRCEASMTIARLRHDSGDYEGALRFASDALMIATRYGMELRKITLRTDIARTMAARGHPVTAQKLAKTAISVASRQRFHTAIDRAEQVLLEIPQISPAIRQSDSTGRRHF